jgi:hypothetical protein
VRRKRSVGRTEAFIETKMWYLWFLKEAIILTKTINIIEALYQIHGQYPLQNGSEGGIGKIGIAL